MTKDSFQVLKPLSSDATVIAVWHEDPAIDKEASDLDGYMDNVARNPGCWSDFLKFKPGQEPTKFIIGTIPPSTLTNFEDQCTLGRADQKRNTLHTLCFVRGIRDIQNCGELMRGEPEVPKTDPGQGLPKHIAAWWVEKTFVRDLRQCVLFIGGLVWSWQQFGEDDAKN
jgi:hypothetical protein